MYQVIEGYGYEGPPIREHSFFYELDNAEDSALLYMETMSSAVRCDEYWIEVIDSEVLEGFQAERVWLLIEKYESGFNLKERVDMHVVIRKIKIKDSLDIDDGIEIYNKKEI